MTSAELIKALRICTGKDDSLSCTDCPYHKHYPGSCRYEASSDAADALEAADEKIADYTAAVEALDDSNDAYIKENERLKKRIAELEAQLPKEGEWITTRTEYHDGEIYCSVCDFDAPTEGDYRQVKTNYCPNCGAKMDGERKDERDEVHRM